MAKPRKSLPAGSRGRRIHGLSWVAALSPLAAMLSGAQSPASQLDNYVAARRVQSVSGTAAVSFSGVAFHPGTHTLYVVDNDNAVIYELDTNGVLLRSLATGGFQDPEGIAWQGDDAFLIAEEGRANIVRLRLPRSGAGPIPRSEGVMLNLGPDMGNSGIEGVAYRAADRTAFAVKETSPSRMYRIVLDSAGNPAQSFSDQPFDIGNKSGDAADLAALDDGNFILVNQEQDRLEGFDPQGKPLSNVTLGMSKPEGIAYDAATGTIYVVGEPREFAVFRPGPGVVGLARATAGSLAMSVGRGSAGTGPVLNLLLEHSEFVTVSLSTLDGGRMGVFQGRLGPGPHALSLGRLPMGFGICRVLAGSESRSLKLMPD